MKIALLGDIALIGKYDRAIDAQVDQRVQCIKELVKDCDYVIANQESVLTDKTTTKACKGVYLRSGTENVKTLEFMGVTHVSLANNHIYDYESQGVKDTINTLKKAGIEYFGLCDEPVLLEKENERVMVDGFCCLSANARKYGQKKGFVRTLSYDSMEEFLKKSEENQCFPIASVHYGIEGLHYPALEHLQLFRNLANKHHYILHGNHPHAIQGLEKVDDSLLIYAQGNLCFDNCEVTSIHEVDEETEESRKGYVVLVEILDNKIISYDVKAVTDLPDGFLKEDESVYHELQKYSEDLSLPLEEIECLRNQEIKEQQKNGKKHDIKFYLHRLNYKYIGAYCKGRIHAKQYNNTIIKGNKK